MNSPRVIELPRRLEPVSEDNFADRPTAAEVIVLRPRATVVALRPAAAPYRIR